MKLIEQGLNLSSQLERHGVLKPQQLFMDNKNFSVTGRQNFYLTVSKREKLTAHVTKYGCYSEVCYLVPWTRFLVTTAQPLHVHVVKWLICRICNPIELTLRFKHGSEILNYHCLHSDGSSSKRSDFHHHHT